VYSVYTAPLATNDLFISEYIEGTGNNKAIEIYNGTGATVDLAVGRYSLELYLNGGASPNAIKNLDGFIVSGDVFVFANPSANAAILAQADDASSTFMIFDGDDAVVLKKNGVVIDVFGQVGFDPGTAWGSGLTSTLDHTLVRKSSVCAGDPVGNNAFDPSVQWNGFPVDTTSNLGSHTAACTPTAAHVSLGGRVLTSGGQGIRNAVVTLQGGDLAEPKTYLTGAFGYFSFDDLPVGQTYVLSVRTKGYLFAESSQVVNLGSELLDANFVARP
jgi:predicted extracellular nuclease